MKISFDLSPSIEHIERRLIGINEGLIQAVQRGDTSAAVAAVVRASPEWADFQNALADTGTGPDPLPDRPPPRLPEHLKDIISRRAAVRSLTRKAPEPGLIVRVEKIMTPREKQMDAVLMAPLHVLLDAPAESPVLWHGWIAAAETEYAGWWDFVLQEQDQPFDPEAGIIQLWNPVRLYLPMAGPVAGYLSPARMQAVRSLAADFIVGDVPEEIAPWPGRVAARTTRAGLSVCTGSPLAGGEDPRLRFQEIYFEAAEAVREPARLALRELAQVPAGRIGNFLNNLIAQAGRLAERLLPEPQVAVAMKDEMPDLKFDDLDDDLGKPVPTRAAMPEETPDLIWPDHARLRILDLTESGEGRIEIRSFGLQAIMVAVHAGEILLDKVAVEPGESEIIAWDNDATHLQLTSAAGRTLNFALRETV